MGKNTDLSKNNKNLIYNLLKYNGNVYLRSTLIKKYKRTPQGHKSTKPSLIKR